MKARRMPAILSQQNNLQKLWGLGVLAAGTRRHGVEAPSPQRRAPSSSQSGEPCMYPAPGKSELWLVQGDVRGKAADLADRDLDAVGPE